MEKAQKDLIERVRDEVTSLRGQKLQLLGKIKDLGSQNTRHLKQINELENTVGELQGRMADVEKMLDEVLKI
ncbi:MAG: hypothetical protein QF415_12800 [Candidatus Undinarchaeales archaeon]|jgi:chromosome segregation ATPase|nr:hypothetical protein [Candidatus Undinarchaeales archaeon]MDP7493916.1 hypothetical protein [Candidatus Undinarchaeales archaeon]